VRNWLIWKELTRKPTAELATPNVGNHWGYEIDGVIVAPKACRYHLLASELAGMTASVTAPVMVEIGGGYGGLAEFFFRLKPQAAWVDYDLPETAMIAAFFHMGARGADKVRLYGECATPRAKAELTPGHTYIMPNFAIREVGPRTADVVVNMFSLSEVGREPLDALLERIHVIAGEWFVHHNMDRAGVINRGFERIPASTFAIDPATLPRIATGFDPFHGPDGDYRWFLHRRSA
jgi:putative sugar O-methyltransferase